MYADNLMVNDAYVKRFVLDNIRVGIIKIERNYVFDFNNFSKCNYIDS